MSVSRICYAMLAIVSLGISAAAVPAAEPISRESLGRRVPDFVLPNTNGDLVALSDYGHGNAVVVVFFGTSCPIGNAYVPVLSDLQKRYADQGVQVLAINSNLADDAEEIAAHAKEFEIPFPVLNDEKQIVADLFAAERTPEAFLVDRRGNVVYRGRIDDRFGYTYRRAEAKRHDLEEALKELLAGKEISQPRNEPEGCLITRRDRIEDRENVTYAKHVSRILHQRCANCHRPGTVAPFSLLTYEDADTWSDMVLETVLDRRMPPWDVDPRHGDFRNELRMPTEEIDTLVAWVENGKPAGDDADLPEPPEFESEWMMGKPDIIYDMPEEYTVQASGTVEYQYFVTKTDFGKDVWVRASEARPGNWDVVHHIIGFIREEGSEELGRLPLVAGYAPGEEPTVYPEGTGFRIPKGAEILWQVHYTPTGKVEKDRSQIGLILCKEQPERDVLTVGIMNPRFQIPAGAKQHQVVSEETFSKDIELLSLMPHMHLRGSKFRYTAKYPDGSSEVLLNVPNYDFNWQHRYLFRKPFPLPAGTTLECVAHYDNSAENPANPNPNQAVYWGDQTWEEMMIGWYEAVVVD